MNRLVESLIRRALIDFIRCPIHPPSEQPSYVPEKTPISALKQLEFSSVFILVISPYV